jgi:hypothetical protein
MTLCENGEGVAKTSAYKNETFCLSQHLAFNPTSGCGRKNGPRDKKPSCFNLCNGYNMYSDFYDHWSRLKTQIFNLGSKRKKVMKCFYTKNPATSSKCLDEEVHATGHVFSKVL